MRWGESMEGGGLGRAMRKKQMCEQEEGSQAAREGEERLVGKGLGGGVVRADREARPGQGGEGEVLNGWGGVGWGCGGAGERGLRCRLWGPSFPMSSTQKSGSG